MFLFKKKKENSARQVVEKVLVDEERRVRDKKNDQELRLRMVREFYLLSQARTDLLYKIDKLFERNDLKYNAEIQLISCKEKLIKIENELLTCKELQGRDILWYKGVLNSAKNDYGFACELQWKIQESILI
jgi:hypothetical protein